MKRAIAFLALMGLAIFLSCGKQDSSKGPESGAEATATGQPAGGPHALVYLKNGSRVPGTIVASTQTDMVVAGDDGIERRIPLTQIKSVEYSGAPTAKSTPAIAGLQR